jgi:hypothetical protein
MDQSGSERRRPVRAGALLRKYGKSPVRELREICGASFAAGIQETATLSDILYTLDAASLFALQRHHDAGVSADMPHRGASVAQHGAGAAEVQDLVA